MTTSTKRILTLAKHLGALRASDLEAHGLRREYLSRLAHRGLLERQGRGVYTLPGAWRKQHHTLVQVATRVPIGVVCLLSALSFHELTTQQPRQVWLAVPRDSQRPKIEYPPLRVVVLSKPAFCAGIESHRIEGRPIRIYSVAKTLADCFKHRNTIGLDVAIEALNEAWSKRSFTMSELTNYAAICRVSRVIRPYLEALTT